MASLVGKYRLLSHGTYSSYGEFRPTSSELLGEIKYGNDGSLDVLILLKTDPMLAKEIIGYVGTYEVVSETEVIHRMSVATSAKRCGSSESRNYKIDGNRLFLSVDYSNGEKFEACWERLG